MFHIAAAAALMLIKAQPPSASASLSQTANEKADSKQSPQTLANRRCCDCGWPRKRCPFGDVIDGDLLETELECSVQAFRPFAANPLQMGSIPGRKTDTASAEWIANQLAPGMLKPKLRAAVLVSGSAGSERHLDPQTAQVSRERKRIQSRI